MFFSSIIYAITKEKSNITLFIKNIVKFVLYPVTLIAILIIYIYLIKILVIVETPANEIFRIVTCIFAAGYPVVIMIRNYKDDNKFYCKSVKIVPWLYIPLILLQGYALILRVVQYGCTGVRYIGFFFIVLELVIIAFSIYRKKDVLEFSLLVAVVLTLFVTISPLNYEKVGVISQAKRLEKIIPDGTKYDELSSKEKEKVNGICNYLSYEDDVYINKYVSQSQKEIIDEYANRTYDVRDDKENSMDYVNITYSNGRKSIDIKKYNSVTVFNKEDNYIDDKYQNMYVDLLIELY